MLPIKSGMSSFAAFRMAGLMSFPVRSGAMMNIDDQGRQ
jgi:hypothetical protein